MKLKHLFATLSLAIVAGAGVAAGVSSGNAQKTEAISAGDTVYVSINSDWYSLKDDGTFYIRYWKNSVNYVTPLSQLDGQLYTGTLPSCDGFQLSRGENNADGSTKMWNYSQNCDLSTLTNSAALNNYVKMSGGWDNPGTTIEEYQPDKTIGNAYLRGSWSGGWSSFEHQMTVESATVTTIEGVLLGDGEQIKMMKIDGEHLVDYYGASSVTGNAGATFDGQNVIIHGAARYNITVTTGENTCIYNVDAFVDTDFDAADEFGENFVKAMNSNCPYNYSTSRYNAGKDAETLAAAWKAQSEAYDDLTAKAKEYLNDSHATAENITAFQSAYDYVYGNYAGVRLAANGGDFAGRNPAISRDLAVIQPLNVEGSSYTSIIAIIGAVSLVAIGGFFFIRRKRA